MKNYKHIIQILLVILILMVSTTVIVALLFTTGIFVNTTDKQIVEITTIPMQTPTITEVESTYIKYCQKTSSDPYLYPITKNQGLDEFNIPEVTNSGLPGGRESRELILADLSSMFEYAKSKGINIQIVSGYRSYKTQQAVFEGYVQNEKNKNPGISDEEAQNRANVYSAKPGHSEHQLGTTVDVACVSCTAFTFSKGNIEVYDFLQKYANDYGFVISYPEDTTEITGYKYEPWHIRYIGKELATMYKQENLESEIKQPLQEFLTKICQLEDYG